MIKFCVQDSVATR